MNQTMRTSGAIDKGLNGVAVYNPSLWNDEELGQYFIARQDVLARIVKSLRREKPEMLGQHQLILGLRGMGKTTLLRRIALCVREDESLNEQFLALSFPEEQYNLAKLKDLWLNCLDALGDALEAQGDEQGAEALDDVIANASGLNADQVREHLVDAAKKLNKTLLLLIDNIDLVFDRLKKDHWSLREVMQSTPSLLFIGASAKAVEATYQYDAAFYDFFKVFELKPLTLDESYEVLMRLAEVTNTKPVVTILQQDRARISTLHTLTGGNPRTVILLFKVLSQGLEGDVRSDLEGLLDMVTPLYKARFEELADSAQQIVDALALHWNPASAKQLAEKLDVTVNHVSAQLSRLETIALVEKVPAAKGKRAAFQISERFFNIWYLMRASRRLRKKLVWLVYFLKMFFSAQELELHCQKQLRNIRPANQRDAEYTLALAQISSGDMRRAMEYRALYSLYHHSGSFGHIDKMFDMTGEDKSLATQAQRIKTLEKLRQEIRQIIINRGFFKDSTLKDDASTGNLVDEFTELLLGTFYSTSWKVNIVKLMTNYNQQQFDQLHKSMLNRKKEDKEYLNEHVELIYKAIAQGVMTDGYDVNGARAAALDFNSPIVAYLPWVVQLLMNDSAFEQHQEETKKALLAIEQMDNTKAWVWMAKGRYSEIYQQDYEVAKKYYLKANEIENNNALPLICYGRLDYNLNNFETAKKAFESALAIDNSHCWGRGFLAQTYFFGFDDYNRAANHFLKVIELDSNNFGARNNLAWIYAYKLGKVAQAIEHWEACVEVWPDDADVWKSLYHCYALYLNNAEQAVRAITKAVELSPDDAGLWNDYGFIKMYLQHDAKGAKECFIKSIKLDEKLAYPLVNLAILGRHELHDHTAYEQYFEEASKLTDDFQIALIDTIESLIRVTQWPIAKSEFARLLQQEIAQQHWSSLVSLVQLVVEKGHSQELLDIIDQSKIAQQWLPMREALACIVDGSDTYLNGIAPEVRIPAQALVEQLTVKTQ